MRLQENIIAAIDFLKNAEALLITAGAGMGVDSGLPDFRGPQGFWNAYPLYGKDGISMYEIARPASFNDDPQCGWGFYGHRFNLYQATTPHEGFQLLLNWIDRMGWDYFVATSNVDGHFEKAGFPGPLALLMAVPGVNVIVLFFLAFAPWPSLDRPAQDDNADRPVGTPDQ